MPLSLSTSTQHKRLSVWVPFLPSSSRHWEVQSMATFSIGVWVAHQPWLRVALLECWVTVSSARTTSTKAMLRQPVPTYTRPVTITRLSQANSKSSLTTRLEERSPLTRSHRSAPTDSTPRSPITPTSSMVVSGMKQSNF